MVKTMQIWLKLSLTIGVSACSATPENPPSGSCSLSCGKARVAAAEFTIKALSKPQAVLCTEDYGDKSVIPTLSPVTVRFKITQAIPTSFTGGAAAGTPTPIVPVTEIPVANVGFDPVVQGSMALAKTAADLLNENKEVTRARFGGVVTPPSEWCSDSCGIMTFEVWPNCVKAGTNDVVAGVAAGNATSDASVAITVKNPI